MLEPKVQVFLGTVREKCVVYMWTPCTCVIGRKRVPTNRGEVHRARALARFLDEDSQLPCTSEPRKGSFVAGDVGVENGVVALRCRVSPQILRFLFVPRRAPFVLFVSSMSKKTLVKKLVEGRTICPSSISVSSLMNPIVLRDAGY